MRLTYTHLRRHPRVFRHMTGLTVAEFDELVHDLHPAFVAREHQRLSRPDRQRAIGGGTPFARTPHEQFLLTIIWLRQYPMHEVLGFLFGVTYPTVGRVLARVLPLLAAAGRDTMRLPDPGKKHRRTLDALLAGTPELAVIIDTFEQPVQRPKARAEADMYYSGKKKQHTHKTQIAVDETTGQIVDVSATVRGPIADLTLLKQSGLLARLPPGVGWGTWPTWASQDCIPRAWAQPHAASRAANRSQRRISPTIKRSPGGGSKWNIQLVGCAAFRP
jgi:hypothetical protein